MWIADSLSSCLALPWIPPASNAFCGRGAWGIWHRSHFVWQFSSRPHFQLLINCTLFLTEKKLRKGA